MGLKELQKSWDLENWVLDLFFRCLDDRTARDLRLADPAMSSTSQTGDNRTIEEIPPASPTSGPYRPRSPNAAEDLLQTPNMMSHHNPGEEVAINMDWYELFNVEGDNVMGLAGSLSNPDYLNPQNLEFLYRFL